MRIHARIKLFRVKESLLVPFCWSPTLVYFLNLPLCVVFGDLVHLVGLQSRDGDGDQDRAIDAYRRTVESARGIDRTRLKLLDADAASSLHRLEVR
jgi:hypothetical protein